MKTIEIRLTEEEIQQINKIATEKKVGANIVCEVFIARALKEYFK